MLKRIAALAGGSALAIALAGGVFGLGPAKSADAVQNCVIGAPLVRTQTTVSAPYGVSSQVADLLTVKAINNSSKDCYGVGIVIHPRTEIQFDKPPERASEERTRMAFGVPRLDEMLCGGLPSGSTGALLGAPGTGKTLLGLYFLVEGAKLGQPGTYFGFYEPPPRLMEKAAKIGIPLDEYCRSGLIKIIWQPPLEHMMDSLAEQLLEHLRRHPTSRRRLFIDGIEGFRAASVYRERMLEAQQKHLPQFKKSMAAEG